MDCDPTTVDPDPTTPPDGCEICTTNDCQDCTECITVTGLIPNMGDPTNNNPHIAELTGLDDDTWYAARATIQCDNGDTETSTYTCFKTFPCNPDCPGTLPGPVVDESCIVSPVADCYAKLQWDDVPGHKITRSQLTPQRRLSRLVIRNKSFTNNNNFMLMGLEPETMYTILLKQLVIVQQLLQRPSHLRLAHKMRVL